MAFSLKIKIGNTILSFLGSISLELYLLQGVFLKAFYKLNLHKENEILCTFITLVCLVLSSYILHFVDDTVLSWYKKYVLRFEKKSRHMAQSD